MSLQFVRSRHTWLVVGVALVMAFISAKFLFSGSVINIVPWGILAFAAAFVASNMRQSMLLGAIFGFVVSYAFLWFDNTGQKTLSNVLILIPLIVVPALFGALCGLVLAWLGWLVRRLISR